MNRYAHLVALAVLGSFVGGCGNGSGTAESRSAGVHDPLPAGAGQAATAQAKVGPGYAWGKVTMADGTTLTGDIQDIGMSISGVSEAGERLTYSPAVNADGTYRQRLAPGEYRFERAQITVQYKNAEFRLPLEPVGKLWNKNRDAADGIEQNFVWKVTGPTPYGLSEAEPHPTNATHWYGMSIGLRPDGYRDDIKVAPAKIDVGTTFTFTFKPLGKGIDGADLKSVTVVRTQAPTVFSNSDFDVPDLIPGPYELTGVAALPDGSNKPLLLQGPGDYPNYKPSVRVDAQKDNILGTLAKPMITFVMD